MLRPAVLRTCVLQVVLIVFAVSAEAQVSFEVASIRPSTVLSNGRYGNYRNTGGPGTADPGRMILENFDIASLILKAWDLPYYALSAPDWIHDVRFDVSATIPPGTTKEQFLLMQQNMLITRLGLAVHREKREMPIYELAVAKGGSKLKAAAPPQDLPDLTSSPADLKRDGDGFLILLPGRTMYAIGMGHASLQAFGETMEYFTSTLAGQLRAPVTDATGLTGKYDFTLRWLTGNAGADGDPGMSLEGAITQQLGLILRRGRGPVDILVVDHVDKTPSEN